MRPVELNEYRESLTRYEVLRNGGVLLVECGLLGENKDFVVLECLCSCVIVGAAEAGVLYSVVTGYRLAISRVCVILSQCCVVHLQGSRVQSRGCGL